MRQDAVVKQQKGVSKDLQSGSIEADGTTCICEGSGKKIILEVKRGNKLLFGRVYFGLYR